MPGNCPISLTATEFEDDIGVAAGRNDHLKLLASHAWAINGYSGATFANRVEGEMPASIGRGGDAGLPVAVQANSGEDDRGASGTNNLAGKFEVCGLEDAGW